MNKRDTQAKPLMSSGSDSITVIGDGTLSGSYLLRLSVSDGISLAFGKFQGGTPITIAAGSYLYVGSAMNGLASRLLRHATRCDGKPPQEIRAHMLDLFPRLSLSRLPQKPPHDKRLHWHVDYLLDRIEVSLTHVYVLRSLERLESSIVQYLEHDTHTCVFERGLGASDSPGNTHLLGVRADEYWWGTLASRLNCHFFP